DGLLTLQTPVNYDQTFCVEVADSAGNKARSELTVVSLKPGDSPLGAQFTGAASFNSIGDFSFAGSLAGPTTPTEVSVGDPVSATVRAYEGTSPYTAKALSLPAGFVFYPHQGIVFGYSPTPGGKTIPLQVSDGAPATTIPAT